MRPRARRNMRREQIERFLASPDITVEQWCKNEHVSESCFYRWLAVFREEEPELFEGTGRGKSQVGWIELSRQDIAQSRALAVVEGEQPDAVAALQPSAPASLPQMAAPVVSPDPRSLRVFVGKACVEVPDGASASTVEVVLKAVAAL